MNNRQRMYIGVFLVFTLLLFGLGAKAAQATEATVSLTILNPPNDQGDIILTQGDSVEVQFIITDPAGELSPYDIVRLIRIDTGEVVSFKWRGHEDSGTLSLRTWRKKALGNLKVQYVHMHTVIADAADSVLVVSDPIIVDILADITELQDMGGQPGEKGDKPAHEWEETSLRFENPDGTWGELVDLKGDTGEQGIQGEKGDKGDTGDTGPQGLQGSAGLAGADGVDGVDGADGICDCPITEEIYNAVLARLEALECHDYDEDGYSVGAVCDGELDCNDYNDQINPGVEEILDNDIDDNCDGINENPQCHDYDGDGFYVGANCTGTLDCNDYNDQVNPDAEEILDNGIDDNCDGIASITRFTDMEDGTIRDNESGLIWLKEADCFSPMDWSSAMYEASLLQDGDCGLIDESIPGVWRLPTREEWRAFMSTAYQNPALVNTTGLQQWTEGDAFTGVQSGEHWSSTEVDETHASTGRLNDGTVYGNRPKVNEYYVWPVR